MNKIKGTKIKEQEERNKIKETIMKKNKGTKMKEQ